jgi:hypothetical protein
VFSPFRAFVINGMLPPCTQQNGESTKGRKHESTRQELTKKMRRKGCVASRERCRPCRESERRTHAADRERKAQTSGPSTPPNAIAITASRHAPTARYGSK